MIIANLAVFSFAKRRVRLIPLALMGAVAFGLGVVVSLTRAVGTQPLVQIVTERPEYLNPANSEFGAPLLTITEVIRRVPAEAPHRLGLGYVNALGSMVPLVIWPNRPDAAGEWYAKTFYPGEFSRGGGFAFSPVAEAYLNFGSLGVVIVFLCVGFLIRVMQDHWRLERGVGSLSFVAYVLMTPWLFLFFRVDTVSLLKGYAIFNLVPLVGLFVLIRALVRPQWPERPNWR
jgi:hypothetical protein